MVTLKRRKELPITFNVVNSYSVGFFHAQGKRANQVSSFVNNMKQPKNVFVFLEI